MQYALSLVMTLLGRLFAVAGISLVLTLFLLVIFQDGSVASEELSGSGMTQVAADSVAASGASVRPSSLR